MHWVVALAFWYWYYQEKGLVIVCAGEKRTFMNGKTGSIMTGMPIRVEPYGCYTNAVVVEVSGCGYYTGEASYWMEEGDPKARGFRIH